MNHKIILIAGIVILILSLFADSFGLGREPGFGLIQIGGTIIGLALIIIGIVKLRRK